MLGGRAADLLGRRRVFLAGTALFALCLAGLRAVANSRGLLIGARALQGSAAPCISPATLAIITTSFAEGRERNRALGVWGAMGGTRRVVRRAARRRADAGARLAGDLRDQRADRARDRDRARPARDPRPRRPMTARATSTSPARCSSPAGSSRSTYGIVRTDTLGWGVGRRARAARVRRSSCSRRSCSSRRASPSAPLVPLSIFRIGQLRAANVVVVLLCTRRSSPSGSS